MEAPSLLRAVNRLPDDGAEPSDTAANELAAGLFVEMLDLASASAHRGDDASGVDWPDESHDQSLARAADE